MTTKWTLDAISDLPLSSRRMAESSCDVEIYKRGGVPVAGVVWQPGIPKPLLAFKVQEDGRITYMAITENEDIPTYDDCDRFGGAYIEQWDDRQVKLGLAITAGQDIEPRYAFDLYREPKRFMCNERAHGIFADGYVDRDGLDVGDVFAYMFRARLTGRAGRDWSKERIAALIAGFSSEAMNAIMDMPDVPMQPADKQPPGDGVYLVENGQFSRYAAQSWRKPQDTFADAQKELTPRYNTGTAAMRWMSLDKWDPAPAPVRASEEEASPSP